MCFLCGGWRVLSIGSEVSFTGYGKEGGMEGMALKRWRGEGKGDGKQESGGWGW